MGPDELGMAWSSQRSVWKARWVIGPWLVLALVFTPGTIYLVSDRISWVHILLHFLTMFLIWAAYTPLIAAMLRRQPLMWPPTRKAIAIHIALGILLVLLHSALMSIFDSFVPSLHGFKRYTQSFVENVMNFGAFGLVLYAATAAFLAALDALRRYHLRERSIVQVQLDALMAQLEPHLLFNALNALSELVYSNPVAADRALTQLSGLLRKLLDRRTHEHSLREEQLMLREYAAIQQTLLGERLQMSWNIPEHLLDASVPTLLLQPIFENAIRHGVSQLRHGGRVTVHACIRRGRLRLSVYNDSEQSSQKTRERGVGLSNTRLRLQTLYGSDHLLELDLVTGGTEVSVELPWRRLATSP
jgi:sensor histidine kinase YesM